MKTKSPSVDTIKAEAMKRFDVFYEYDESEWLEARDKVKDFITSEIDRVVEAVVGKIKKMEKEERYGDFWISKNDLLQKLSTLKEK